MTDNVAGISRETAASAISPKVGAAALGAAVATIFWTIAGATFWKDTFTASEISGLCGASATVLAFILGYFIRDRLRNE
ncbi:hypothetical protein GCM10012275_37070 [Longimycelium tulufanense]|uniref:Uncharacterized protein n=1 Tax=Longimycelium tulufanense TaxID=907463 RepID=A0A8J3CA20_9PSEU|nr:hypothetical protein [Longimycelium tulufanense]GGM62984.1 hypothetical protein GCM10012275_37070 [Longimycelium tulufanense]